MISMRFICLVLVEKFNVISVLAVTVLRDKNFICFLRLVKQWFKFELLKVEKRNVLCYLDLNKSFYEVS